MAMQVEVTTTLASLSNLSERRSGATLQHTFFTALSKPSGKARQPLEEEVEEEEKSPTRPATMPPAASRPRLTPRPFSRDQPSDTFILVKSPLLSLKDSPMAPKGSAQRRMSGEDVPLLVDQKTVQGKSPQGVVANVPCPHSQTNTVILFESVSAGGSGWLTGSPEKPCGPLQDHKGVPPEAPHTKPFGRGSSSIHRQHSLSSEVRPDAWTPRPTVERKGTFSGILEENLAKGQESSHHCSRRAGDGQPRARGRPVSAIFLESLKDHNPSGLEASSETSVPEKPWGKKPRPLSIDLTARFENYELSVQRSPCPPESPGRNPGMAHLEGSAMVQRGPRSEAGGPSQADHASKAGLKNAAGAANSLDVQSKAPPQIQRLSLKEGPPLGQNDPPKDPIQVSAKERKSLWEQRLRSPGVPKERETLSAAPSAIPKSPSGTKGQPAQDSAGSGQVETCAVSVKATEASGAESTSLRGGSLKKTPDFPDRSSQSPANMELPPPPPPPPAAAESHRKENSTMNIQQRIRELTAESPEAKAGNLRGSFRSRPLSADLKKLFSSSAAACETKLTGEGPEPSRKSASEGPRGVAVVVEEEEEEKEEEPPPCEADPKEGPLASQPWKPPSLPTMSHARGLLERDKEPPGGSPRPGAGPPLAVSHGVQTSSTLHAESGGLRTVRATMFEHTVQRHHVATRPPRPGSELTGVPSASSWALGAEKEARGNPQIVPSRQVEGSAVSEQHKKARGVSGEQILPSSTGGKWDTWHHEKPSARHVEDSLAYQRIEPRYEILQTVGKRVQSEAVAAVPEEKAVTLRSRMSWKEQRSARVGKTAEATWPRSLDAKKNGEEEEEGSVPKLSNVGDFAHKRSPCKELGAPHVQETEQSKSQTGQQAPDFPVGKKDPEATEGRGARPPSGPEKGAREALLADQGEGSPEALKPLSGRLWGASLAGTGVFGGEKEGLAPFLPRRAQGQKAGSKEESSARHKADQDSGGSGHWGASRAPDGGPGVPASESGGGGGGGSQLLPPGAVGEERLRRTLQAVPSHRALDRWRRKTLPHGSAADFEAAKDLLAQEKTHPVSRRDSLQLSRSARGRLGAGQEDGSLTPSGWPSSRLQSQPEPKATYFAVTYHVPDENVPEVSKSPVDPLRTAQAASLADKALVALGAQRAHHPFKALHRIAFLGNPDGSPDGPLDRTRADGAPPGRPGREALPCPPAQVSAESRRRLDSPEGRATEVESRSPSFLRPNQHKGRIAGATERDHGASQGLATQSYRSRVLDLDLLMAEYQEGSRTASRAPEKAGGQGPLPCDLPWERLPLPKSPRGRRQQATTPEPPSGSHQQGPPMARSGPPRAVSMKGGEGRPGGHNLHPSPAQVREAACNPPHGGRLLVEKAEGLPTDHLGLRKKTFLLDEEPGLLARQNQSLWAPHHGVQDLGPVGLARETERPPLSPSKGSGHGGWPKEGSPKPQAGPEEAEEEEESQDCGLQMSNAIGKGGGRSGHSPKKNPPIAPSRATRSHGIWTDSWPACAEKVHLARAKSSMLCEPPGREQPVADQDQAAQRISLGNTPAGRQPSGRRASQLDPFASKGKGDCEEQEEEEEAGQGRGRRLGTRSAQQRRSRSRSFYQEQRAGPALTPAVADQVKQCFGRGPPAGAKDTDSLLVPESSSLYGTWGSHPRHSGDSSEPESPSSETHPDPPQRQLPEGRRLSSFSSQVDPILPHDPPRDQRSTCGSSPEVEALADGSEDPSPAVAYLDFSFLDQTPVLDSSALKDRVQLSKRRRQQHPRAPNAHPHRRSPIRGGGRGGDGQPQLAEEWAESTWMFRDATGETSTLKDDESEGEGKPRPHQGSPLAQPHPRLPIFPGMDPSALKAQLRKRHDPGEGLPVQQQPPKSPKSPFPGGQMFPPGTQKEERVEDPASPPWLKELRRKRRQSQYENQV